MERATSGRAVTTNILAPLARLAQQDPQRLAIVWWSEHDPIEVDARAAWQAVSAASRALAAAGVRAGDVVVIAEQNHLPVVWHFLGAMLLRAVPCLFAARTPKVDERTYAQRLQTAIDVVAPAAVVADPAVAACLVSVTRGPRVIAADALTHDDGQQPEAPAPVAASDLAFIQLSSGSTAHQRAVPVTHAALRNTIDARHQALQVTAADVSVGWVPLAHDLGLVGHLLGPLTASIPAVLISPLHWLASPASLLVAVSRYRGTLTTMPNFAFTFCAERIKDQELDGVDLDSWRVLSNAAEPVRPASFQAFFERFARWRFKQSAFRTAYGLAENTLSVTTTATGGVPRVDWLDKGVLQQEHFARHRAEGDGGVAFVSCGVPMSNLELQIRSERGAALPERQVGEVTIKSTSLFPGYYRDAARTAEVLQDGWLKTGDLGYVAGGELYICGRRKGVIIVGGINVHSEDVEALAASHPAFRRGRVVAFGAPDAVTGSEGIVLAVETRDATPDRRAIERAVRQQVLDGLGVPLRHLVFVPPGWITKTSSGKLARWKNRERWLAEFAVKPAAAAELMPVGEAL